MGDHSKQKVGQSWSKLVALGHRAKLVTKGEIPQMTNQNDQL